MNLPAAIDTIDTIDTIDINRAQLRAWPLPLPDSDGDKEVRGHVLIVAGSREIPGAAILAATAALRAGAGKLSIATAASVATLVAVAMPEARVIGLPETADGGFELDAAMGRLQALAGRADCLLIGPGMQDEAANCALVRALLPVFKDSKIVLDACAMGVVCHADDAAWRFEQPVLLTPHAGEMAHLSGQQKSTILDAPHAAALAAARRWNAGIVLKGALTVIAMPDGRRWQHSGGNIGLAMSGSGDTLAGIIAGIAARGAALEQAGAWGVALHGMAGERLAWRHGQIGYLARELPKEIPALLRTLCTH